MGAGEGVIGGRFRIVRRLGAGGMGSVLLAEDPVLGRQVAIRQLHPGSGPQDARRFRREMRLAASMAHPNVVRLLDALIEDDEVFLVMEYVDGPTLAARLRTGPLEPGELLTLLDGLADALDHIHARGIVHRDVRPGNILIGPDGSAKLADLGLARAADASGLTGTTGGVGAPGYVAPERLAGERATAASDLWALAAVAREALTGATATPSAVPDDLGGRWGEAPRLVDALRRGLAPRPEDRPGTARALADEISQGVHEALAARRPSTRDRHARRRLPLPLALAAVMVALAGVVVALAVSGGSGGGKLASSSVPATVPKAKKQRPSGSAAATHGATTQHAGSATTTKTAPQPTSTVTTHSTPAARTTQAGSAAATPAPPSAGAYGTSSPRTPGGAVQAFYQRAAAHRYSQAWALAGPALRAQLNGYDSFTSQFSSVRRIRFGDVSVADRGESAATVAFTTTATHTDRVDHCSGTATTAPTSSGHWVVSGISVSCG